jgi:DNA-binding response OmpR family regulator/signal transduction histidine kinase
MENQNKADILIVDDRLDNLRVLSQILEEQGYQVRKAISGKTALRAAFLSPPDVILLDIKMPELDGYEVCEQLKAQETTKDIPVIFISALHEALDKVRAFEIGGIDYITKPFQSEEVIVRIENQLTIQRQKKQLQVEIEQRQQTEEILRQSRSFLASILNSSLDGIAAVESVRKNSTGEITDFRCLSVNPVIARVFGKKKTDLIGKLGVRKILDKVNANLFDSLVKVVETGEPLEQDIFYQYDALKYWFHFIAVKLGDGFAITVRNITTRKEMELELEKTNQDLEAFSYSVSHDLRTYISHINIASSLLKEELPLDFDEEQKDLINIIHNSSERTMTILEGMMQLSFIKYKEMVPGFLNISNLVTEIVDYLQQQYPSQKVKVIIEPDLSLTGDFKTLRIALENILKNAFKYTRNKPHPVIEFGVIKFDTELWQEKIKLADINPKQIQDKNIYFIKDNGVGFDMKKANDLFVPFKRLHDETEFEGTGIGLSTVQRIIERHDGFIWAESQVNQGATFYFTL